MRAGNGRRREIIAGLDEAGRGPLAGPVVAAAVVFKPGRRVRGLADSKALNAGRRRELFARITEAAYFGVGAASIQEIERLNILHASHLAMRRALKALPLRPERCLVDGNRDPELGIPSELIVGGDAREPTISAASILAKVIRDRLMAKLAARYPDFGWERNAGYCTRHHLDALELVGPTPHHRKSFAPVAQLSFKIHL